ncbi:MAG: hypothetical protein J3K34DRAFT_434077, partial [Monoraphidium minutum]
LHAPVARALHAFGACALGTHARMLRTIASGVPGGPLRAPPGTQATPRVCLGRTCARFGGIAEGWILVAACSLLMVMCKNHGANYISCVSFGGRGRGAAVLCVAALARHTALFGGLGGALNQDAHVLGGPNTAT